MLYHVSILELKELNLKPRVPKFRVYNENDTIKRVCFSNSIKGCLKTMCDIQQILWKSYLDNTNIKLFVYVIDENKINKNSIMTPKEIYANNYVPDVLKTNEYWILEDVKLNLIKTICLDESMYNIFEVYEEDDDEQRCYGQIIDYYLKNNDYVYRNCTDGEIIKDIKNDLYLY